MWPMGDKFKGGKRADVREVARRFRTTNPRVFGSVVHGTDQDGSDLDLLVDALPGATLFDFCLAHPCCARSATRTV